MKKLILKALDFPQNDQIQSSDNKQLLDEIFVVSKIIKVEASVISRGRRPDFARFLTLSTGLP